MFCSDSSKDPLYHLIFQREKLRVRSKCIKRGGAVEFRPPVVIPPAAASKFRDPAMVC